MMKLIRINHYFSFFGLIHKTEILPFTGAWDFSVALSQDEEIVSEVRKMENNMILVEKYGFKIPIDIFMNLLKNPELSVMDLLLASSNILIHSEDEYSIAKMAKKIFFKYGYFFNTDSKKLYYYILSDKPNIFTDIGVFIDPNNPF